MSKNKKVVLIVSAIALVCIIGAGVVIGILFSRGSDFAEFNNIFGRNMENINESAALNLDGASVLAIDCDSADIEFVDSDEAKVTIVGEILGVKDTDDVLSVYKEGGVLHIDSKMEPMFFSISTGLDLTVYMPADSMMDLRIKCASGDILMDGMQFGDMNIKKTSGRASISECSAGDVLYDSTSGGTQMSGCDFDSLRIDSTSGNIDIADVTGTITIDSTSGSVDIHGAQDAIDVVSTSGGVSIDYNGTDVAPITVKVTSGGAKLYLDADAAFDLRAKVTSGNIDTNMDITVTGDLGDDDDYVNGSCNGGGNLVSITTTSGGIDIFSK